MGENFVGTFVGERLPGLGGGLQVPGHDGVALGESLRGAGQNERKQSGKTREGAGIHKKWRA